MKKWIKSQKGVTLIILLITIIVIAILGGVVIRNLDIGTDIKEYNYMCADIELLESKVIAYYNENSSLPIKGNAFNAKDTLGSQASSRDDENYYEIDLDKLYNITLNYGGGTKENGDIYVINGKTHIIYYLKGVMFEKTRCFKKKVEVSETAIVVDLRIANSVTPVTVDNTKVSMVKEGVPIPVGFYYVGGTKNTGVVISDNSNDENKGDGYNVNLVGNQFVWVPVLQNQKINISISSPQVLTKLEIKDPLGKAITTDKNGNTIEANNSIYNIQINPTINGKYTVTATSGIDEVTETIQVSSLYAQDFFDTTDTAYTDSTIATYSNSVNKYGGFYIARYEAGCENPRTTTGDALTTVMSKKSLYPYNYVTQVQSIAQSTAMYSSKRNVTSALANSGAWDRTLNWLIETGATTRYEVATDSQSWGNYRNSSFSFYGNYSEDENSAYQDIAQKTKTSGTKYRISTGTTSYTKRNNIFDLAGNCREWTLEEYPNNTVVPRGGYYIVEGLDRPASDRRKYSATTYSYVDMSFRPVIYINV